jgi:hypothetical protein
MHGDNKFLLFIISSSPFLIFGVLEKYSFVSDVNQSALQKECRAMHGGNKSFFIIF